MKRRHIIGLASVLLGCLSLVAAEPWTKRWAFEVTRLESDDEAQGLVDYVNRAAKAGCNGFAFIAGDDYMCRRQVFELEGSLSDACGCEEAYAWTNEKRKRYRLLEAACRANGMEIVPLIWSVGYASPTHADTGLASVQKTDGAAYVAHGGKLVFEPQTALTLPVPAEGNGAISFKLDVKPNTTYRFVMTAKTDEPEIKSEAFTMIFTDAKTGESRSWNRPYWWFSKTDRAAKVTKWNTFIYDVHSGSATRLSCYLGLTQNAIRQGIRLDYRDLSVREIGLQTTIVRDSAPFVVTDAASGRVYEAGKDYVVPANPERLTFHGKPMQAFDLTPGSAIAEGTRVRISAYEPICEWGKQFGTCLTDPALTRYFNRTAVSLQKEFNLTSWFLSMDEIRCGCRCERCKTAGLTAGHQFARVLKAQRDAIRKVAPTADIYVWPDMYDPGINARKTYYQQPSTCEVDWDTLPKDVIMAVWGTSAKRKASFDLYESKGFRTFCATYYDEKSREFPCSRPMLEAAAVTPHCVGWMYTPWAHSRDLLEDFCRYADSFKAPSVVFRPGETEVLIAEKAPGVVRFAAREATNFLSRVLGVEVPVVTSPTPGKRALVLGDNAWSRAAGIDVKPFARDAYTIVAKGDRVYVAGRDEDRDVDWVLKHGGKMAMYFEQGSLMGLYDFLERHAGVRFYFPGSLGEVTPHRDAVVVPEGTLRKQPDYTARYLMAWKGAWYEPGLSKEEEDARKTLNYIRLRFETTTVPCCHGSIFFGYLKRFGKTHPEYFALLSNGTRSTDPKAEHPGQLCWTSGIVDEMYADVKSYLTGEDASVRGVPNHWGSGCRWGGNCIGRKYVDIMPQDSFAGCLCDRCKATYRMGDRDYATELIWSVTSNIAARLTAEGVDGTVSMMAYGPYGRVPAFELPKNIEVMVARMGPWCIRNKEKWAKDNADILAWSEKLGHPVWIWNYVNKWGLSEIKLANIPQVTPRAFAAYYKKLGKNIRGAFAESETDRYFFNYLNYYVFSRLCWDNDVDVDALLEEHHRLMFGAGAADMAGIYEALEDKWMNRTMGKVTDTPLGPVVEPASDEALWTDVYSPKVIARFHAAIDRALAKVAPGSLEAQRMELVRREFVTPLESTCKRYNAKRAAVKALRHSLRDDAAKPLSLVPFSVDGKTSGKLLETRVTARRDGEMLEVAFDCAEPQMGARATAPHEPDDPELWRDDCVEIVINPSADRKNYHHIIVNSDGAWSDAKHSTTIRSDKNANGYAWNSGLTVSVEKRAESWKAVIRIPFAAFPEIKDECPIEFARERHIRGGTDAHPYYHWSEYALGFHDLENAGTLTDILKK